MEGTLEGLLEGWARWMRKPDEPDDYLDRSLGIEGYTIESTESDGQHEALQHRLAETVNAVINSMPPAERAAFYAEFGLAVGRGTAPDDARRRLEVGLCRRGVVVDAGKELA